MPIEIRELHIRMSVNEQDAQPPSLGEGVPEASAAPKDKDSIIAECVEQVMEIMRRKKER